MKKLFFRHAIPFILFFVTIFAHSCTFDVNENAIESVQLDQTTELTIDEAEKELLEILEEMDAQLTRSGAPARNRRIANRFSTGSYEALTRAEEDEREPYVHIFNFEDEEGFAIMSGDERVTPLLALTEGGAISTSEVIDNPGLVTFLSKAEPYYLNEIVRFDSMAVANPNISLKTSGWTTQIYNSILFEECPVQWGQHWPYNQYTPNQYPTCCLTTAVSQLMAIYKYPASYGGYTFNWNEMLKHQRTMSSGGTLTAGQKDIARLMQQLGLKQNLDVSYQINNSGALPSNTWQTLHNFGFKDGGYLLDYSTDKLVAELKNYPGLIHGYSHRTKESTFFGLITWYEYSGGHSWLADGLMKRSRTITTYKNGKIEKQETETLYYVYCNFGWDGDVNGYYLSNAFDTNEGPDYTRSEGSDYNYQYNMKMSIGIRAK